MEERIIIFKQNFVIDNENILGTIEKIDGDDYAIVYKDGKEYNKELYNGSYDDYAMISKIESLI